MRSSADQRGFTLLEFLVVLGIIGVLSTLSVLAIRSARAQKRDVQRAAAVKELRTSLEMYLADNNGYPAGKSVVLGAGGAKALCGGENPGWKAACDPGDYVYMGYVGAAPTPADGACTDGQNAYVYTQNTTTTYTLTFCLGDVVGDLQGGQHTADANGVR